MPEQSQNSNRRIAKNTLLLYLRTILTLLILLYTSRVILEVLGVDDYGIYNVVGGVVGMFSLISSSLSSAISRFITFELGKGDVGKLKTVFSTSVNIQIGLSIVIFLLGEIVGGWFLNTKMNIPEARMGAANWVLHCSLAMFCVGLISIPYNACIIAHERMKAFAYVSILEAVLRLLICYLIIVSPIDKLVSYVILLLLISIVIRLIYGRYCGRNFEECHYKFTFDRSLLKEMVGFAGWGFFTNTAWLFNTQGINILINLFFGVGMNAARGIATQVESALMKFAGDFTTALNPQITKSYAIGDYDAMNKLICRGAKFSFFLIFIMSLPVLMETEYILRLWLKTVPEHTGNFVRLTIIAAMAERLGGTGYTACMATGNIRRYSIWITSVGCMVFPLTWISYKLGAPVEACYVLYFLVYVAVLFVRLWIMRGLLNFPTMLFVRKVLLRIAVVVLLAIICPMLIVLSMEQSFVRLLISVIIGLISVAVATYVTGLEKTERESIIDAIVRLKHKYIS